MPVTITGTDEILSPAEFFQSLGLSRQMFYQYLRSGRIPAPPRLGRRNVWTRSYLLRVRQALGRRKGGRS